MEGIGRRHRWVAIVVLAALWTWPSALFLPPILGRDSLGLRLVSISFTFLIGLVVTWLAWRYLASGARRFQLWTFIALLVACLVVLPVYYLLVRNGTLGGFGGDRGQALDIALERIRDGQYPYSALTYYGGRITPLPGGLLLAAPAYLILGSSFFMTAYVVPLAAWLTYRVNKSAGAILALAIVLAPAFWSDALASGDLVTTSILAFAVALNALRAGARGGWPAYGWAVALGIVGATRVTSILIALFVVAILIAGGRIRTGLLQFGLVVGVFLAISLPFYIADPDEFSPLHASHFTQGRMGQGLAVLAMIAVVVLLLRARFVRRWPDHVTLALTVATTSVVLSAIPFIVNPSAATLFLTGYGVLGLAAPIGVLAWSGRSRQT